jgi:hypothetical protein
MVFALERLGFTVWAVPTVVLPHHPGHGPVVPIVPEPGPFTSLLDALGRNGRAAEVAAIVSGYFGSAEQAARSPLWSGRSSRRARTLFTSATRLWATPDGFMSRAGRGGDP